MKTTPLAVTTRNHGAIAGSMKTRTRVLAALELNRIRAERRSSIGACAPAGQTSRAKRGRKSTKSAPVASPNLFDVQESTE